MLLRNGEGDLRFAHDFAQATTQQTAAGELLEGVPLRSATAVLRTSFTAAMAP
jgi:hypothetical protein